ncbi:D-2-hydroxyacid dehydrogenase [Halalkalicoccus salilacus]|uniref:D-2-hydroxyacid dehydrogenase n=1 Tax=Halalkalicoccus salilacus TaxID=3117459 RepID=UPI00300EB438
MGGTPDALVLHTVEETHWMNATELRTAIETRRPDLDLRMARTPEESAAAIPGAEVVLASYVPSSLLDRASSLAWIQALSAGVDFFDVERLRERGVVLTSASGVHAQPIAEQVLGYLLAFERGLDRAFRRQRRGVWERFSGGELAGKTLGIVGVGAIGGRIAEFANAIGMRVIGTKRDPSTAPDAVSEIHGPDGLYDVLAAANYVVLSCPLTERTRGLIGRDEIGAMNDDAVLVNVARGGVVDQPALTTALQQRAIRGAALDVFETEPLPSDSPLWDLSNVIVTPHMAGDTPHKHDRIADVFVENYEAFTTDDPDAMRNRVL